MGGTRAPQGAVKVMVMMFIMVVQVNLQITSPMIDLMYQVIVMVHVKEKSRTVARALEVVGGIVTHHRRACTLPS